jgi:hypothetical protein
MRSVPLTVVGLPFYDCAVQFTETKEWTVEEIDAENFTTIRSVDLSANPSRFFSAIGFATNTLSYGLYKFTIRISMTHTDRITNALVTGYSFESTYVQIIPTGISVYLLGQTSLEIGSSQTLDFDPRTFSIDLDRIANVTLLNYKFYCHIFNVTNNTIVSNSIDDLYYVKTYAPYTANETCFVDSGI